jgi:hypothetical protein
LTISSICFFAGLRAFPEPSLTIGAAIYVHPGIVRVVPPSQTKMLAAIALAVAFACGALAASGSAKAPGCSSFKSQAAAQELFVQMGGGPARDVGNLDPDGDGVACEDRPGPNEGFATIGYNRAKRFFYGVATMPATESEDGFACLQGNRHYPDGPRLLKIYRVLRGGDRLISPDVGAEARPDSGRLLWKFDRKAVPPGRYYASFEEKIRPSPYAPSECPGFRSRASYLPRSPSSTRLPRTGSRLRPPLPVPALR